jgi:hypothetical protein
LVAVRWESIPEGAKLGALAALSGACLLGGRAPGSPIARRVPAAASVLFHLGAFLAPVTAASVLVHGDVPLDEQLLSLGAGSALLFHLLGRVERSVVLGGAGLAATVAATVGLGGLTPVPASAWLVALATVALLVRADRAAIAWSGLATVVPLAALAVHQHRPEALDAVSGVALVPGAVGLGAAVVLVALTHRRQSLALLALAATAIASGAAATAVQLDPDVVTWWLSAAAAFVLLEVTALLLRDDPFWCQPLDTTATCVESLALLLAPVGLLAATWYLPLVDGLGGEPAHPLAGAVFGLAALGWYLADLRRHQGGSSAGLGLLVGGGFTVATVGVVGCLLGAAAVGTSSPPVTAAVAGALAVVLVVSGRPGGPVLVPLTVLVGLELVLVETGSGAVLATAAVAGALLLAVQATLHRRAVATWLAAASLVPAGIALGQVADERWMLVGGLVLAEALALVLDRARSGDGLGLLPRVTGSALLLQLAGEDAATIALVSATYLGLVGLDAARRRETWPLLGAAFALPLLAGSLTVLAGRTVAESGVVLSVLAVGTAVAGHRWPIVRLPLVATAATLAGAGLGVATLDPGVLGTVLLLDGAVVLAAGLLAGHPGLTIGGGVVACLGTWQHLDLHGIEAVDAYALPVALLLWLVGTRLADEATSSWVTHTPAVALAGGTALAERLGGGPGVHALLAGAVGLVAVVEGGGRRLAAPLLLGTALLVGLTAYETTAVTAGVPTWAWLATGGTLLVGAGLAMERHELGPVETGRRLVDVVQDNFR